VSIHSKQLDETDTLDRTTSHSQTNLNKQE